MNRQEQIKFIEDNYPATISQNSQRRVRHTFFSKIETELQAYLLGFYVADGNINEKRKTFRIELQNQDSDIIYLYKDIISPDARLYQTKEREFIGPRGKAIHAHGNTGVDINSSQLCNSLVDLGYGYNKSYKDMVISPKIPSHLIRHFIRGYFDGDGCFTMYTYKQDNRPRPYLKVKFMIDAKTAQLITDIQKFLSENDINTNIIYLKRDNMWRISTSSKKECIKLYHFLYDSANFYLTRKFNKFNRYVNTEESQLIAELRNAQEVNVNESNNLPKSAEHPTSEGENVR